MVSKRRAGLITFHKIIDNLTSSYLQPSATLLSTLSLFPARPHSLPELAHRRFVCDRMRVANWIALNVA